HRGISLWSHRLYLPEALASRPVWSRRERTAAFVGRLLFRLGSGDTCLAVAPHYSDTQLWARIAQPYRIACPLLKNVLTMCHEPRPLQLLPPLRITRLHTGMLLFHRRKYAPLTPAAQSPYAPRIPWTFLGGVFASGYGPHSALRCRLPCIDWRWY